MTDQKAQERWLNKNTFTCQRLQARISPAACAEYRAEHVDKVASARDRVGHVNMPGCCHGCKQYKTATVNPKRGARKRKKSSRVAV